MVSNLRALLGGVGLALCIPMCSRLDYESAQNHRRNLGSFEVVTTNGTRKIEINKFEGIFFNYYTFSSGTNVLYFDDNWDGVRGSFTIDDKVVSFNSSEGPYQISQRAQIVNVEKSQ